jgi:hypothetical protein
VERWEKGCTKRPLTFAAYERKTRPFMEVNQATVAEGMVGMIPVTTDQLEQRTEGLLKAAGHSAADGGTARTEHRAIDLSAYDELLAASV